VDGVKATGLDQRLDGALVQALAVHAAAEVEQALEGDKTTATAKVITSPSGSIRHCRALLMNSFRRPNNVSLN
jgi:hypothetical protein